METEDHSPEAYKVNVNGGGEKLVRTVEEQERDQAFLISDHSPQKTNYTSHQFFRGRKMFSVCTDWMTPSACR